MKLLLLLSLFLPCLAFGQTATSFVMSGNAKLFMKDYKDAINDFTKAINLDPKNSQAWFNRGMAKAGLEEHTEAIADYNKALELNSKNQDVYYQRGLSQMTLNRHAEAISDFDKAVIVTTKNVIDSFQNKEIYVNRAKSKAHLQDLKGAVDDLSLAIRMAPNDGLVYCYRGLCKIDLQQQKEGCLDLQKALELNYAQAADLIRENCK